MGRTRSTRDATDPAGAALAVSLTLQVQHRQCHRPRRCNTRSVADPASAEPAQEPDKVNTEMLSKYFGIVSRLVLAIISIHCIV